MSLSLLVGCCMPEYGFPKGLGVKAIDESLHVAWLVCVSAFVARLGTLTYCFVPIGLRLSPPGRLSVCLTQSRLSIATAFRSSAIILYRRTSISMRGLKKGLRINVLRLIRVNG